jgi:hypothetical protein
MSQATHEQVNLMLKLYDLRREPRLREARAWFLGQFRAPSSLEEMSKHYPPGSEGNTNVRMTISYWDMVANIANRGLVDEELFFETSGEQWAVWERAKPMVGTWRTSVQNPLLFSALEEHCRRYEAWREKRAPGSNAAMRQMLQKMMQQSSAPQSEGVRAGS